MASMALEGDVRKSLLDRTDAEKVFRPWWDTLEDMLLNTLIALGTYVGPTLTFRACAWPFTGVSSRACLVRDGIWR